MILQDELTVICKNCGYTKVYTRHEIPERCEVCNEPFEAGEFGLDWMRRIVTPVGIVGAASLVLYAFNTLVLSSRFPRIGSIFLWQFTATVVVFILITVALVSRLAQSGRRATQFIGKHAGLALFLCFFAASAFSIPITIWLSGIPPDWPNLIIGIEINILAGFVFVILHDVLVRRRRPWRPE